MKTDEEYLQKQAGFLFEFKWANYFRKLNDADCGRLIKAMIDYATSKQMPKWANDNTGLSIAFDFIIPTIDENSKKYVEKCKQNSKNRQKGWDNKRDNNESKNETSYDSNKYREKASNPQYTPHRNN